MLCNHGARMACSSWISSQEFHHRFRWLCSVLTIFRVSVCMGDFGADTEKPSWLYSSWAGIKWINDYKTCHFTKDENTKALANTWVDRKGNRKCTGNANLKQSQAYPAGFGKAVNKLYLQHKAELLTRAASRDAVSASAQPDVQKLYYIAGGNGGSVRGMWSDAGMPALLRFLTAPVGPGP